MAEPLDRANLNNLQMRFITVISLQPRLATTHAKLVTHTFGLVNRSLGAHRPRRSPNTPDSLLWTLKHSPRPAALTGRAIGSDGKSQVCRMQGLSHGYPMAYRVHRRNSHTSPGNHSAKQKTAPTRTALVSQHQGGVTVAARGLVAERCASGNEAPLGQQRRRNSRKKTEVPSRKQ